MARRKEARLATGGGRCRAAMARVLCFLERTRPKMKSLTLEKCVAETRARHRGPASSSYELRFHRNAPWVCPSVTFRVGVMGLRDWGRSAQVSVSERWPPGRPELQPRGGPHNGVLDPLELYRARALAAELERDRSLIALTEQNVHACERSTGA